MKPQLLMAANFSQGKQPSECIARKKPPAKQGADAKSANALILYFAAPRAAAIGRNCLKWGEEAVEYVLW